jgi:hypothetical protein
MLTLDEIAILKLWVYPNKGTKCDIGLYERQFSRRIL